METGQSANAAKEAATWFARLRAPDCSTADRQAFHAWLVRDPANAACYERAMRIAAGLSTLTQSDPALRALAADALAQSATGRIRDWASLRGMVGRAGLGAALTVLVLLLLGPWLGSHIGDAEGQRFVNADRQSSQVQLSDGTRMQLDAGTVVIVRMSAARRQLQLESGRAYFAVAKDPLRPFEVDAAGIRTTALGTEFEVALRNESVAVTLSEGSVAVSGESARADWQTRLVPGQQLFASRDGERHETREVDARRVVGWSTGHLHFDRTPLNEVIREWNRYSTVRISLGDVGLGESLVSGEFLAGGDSHDFAGALASVLPLRALRYGDGEILLVRDYRDVDR